MMLDPHDRWVLDRIDVTLDMMELVLKNVTISLNILHSLFNVFDASSSTHCKLLSYFLNLMISLKFTVYTFFFFVIFST